MQEYKQLYQEQVEKIKSSLIFSYLVMDELYTFVKNKKRRYYVWTAIAVTQTKRYFYFYYLSKDKGSGALFNFKDNLPGCCTFLFSFQNFQLYKLRVSGCGKGKSGGLRIIFSYEREKDIVLLIRVYRKAEKENMPKHEIIEEIIYCLENL